MAIRNIRTTEDSILKKTSRKVENFDERLFMLLDDMRDTMYAADGVGLAAVQVGVLKRVVTIDIGDGLIELINPEIIEKSGEQFDYEGCLSLPGDMGITQRPMTVKVRAQNRDGKWCLYQGQGFKTRAFCHEIDHLDGHLYTERLAPKEIAEKIQKENAEKN